MMAGKLASFVGTVQLKLKVEKATSSEDEPAPIYLLDEVVRAAGSNPKNISDVVEALKHRLEFRSSVIKQKALKLVKHAALKGSSELKRSLNQLSPLIRELTHYRCAPDPFKGDIPWKKVQEYARDALEAIHAAPQYSQGHSTMGSESQAARGRIQGFGSDSTSAEHGSHGKDGFDGIGRTGMIGFGNETYVNDRVDTGDSIAETFAIGLRDLTDVARTALGRPTHQPMNSGDGLDTWKQDAYSSHSRPNIVYNRPQIPKMKEALGEQGTVPDVAVSREEHLVDKFCTSSGVRVAPTTEECNSCIAKLHGRNCEWIAKSLDKKLGETWQESLRALCLIEVVTDPGRSHSQAEKVIKEYFVNSPEALKRSTCSAQERVRLRAHRVLCNLGIEQANVPSSEISTGIDLLAVEGEISSGAQQKEVPADLSALMSEIQETDIVTQKFYSIDIESSGSDLLGQDLDAIPLAQGIGNDSLLAPQNHTVVAARSAPDPFANVGEPNSSFSDVIYGDWTSTTPSNPNKTNDPYNLVEFSSQPPASTIPPITQAISDFSFATGHHDQPNYTQMLNQPTSDREMPGSSTGSKDALSIWNAATSGISSTKREDAAFSFIEGAMNDLKKK
eukprot:jgi/Picsp_1/2712/NSC_00941-R1_vhs domain-containing protein at3g16270-like